MFPSLLHQFPCNDGKKYQIGVRSILMPPTFNKAHLNRHTPKISGVVLKLTWYQRFSVQGLSKSGNPDSCNRKEAIFRCVFYETKFPGQTINFCISFLKAIILRVQLGYLGTLYVHTVTRQIFCNTLDPNCLN